MKTIIITLFIASLALPQSKVLPPDGYKMITVEDYKNGFAEYLKFNPMPFYDSADFNGDGISDEVWIFSGSNGIGWGMFVYLKNKNKKDTIIKCDSDSTDKYFTNLYVSVADTGKYVTLCGKGYFDCDKNEPKEIILKLPAINFGTFESANSFFYWNKIENKFTRIWMSD